MKKGKYVIGIDLGTTNCSLAYALAEEDKVKIEQFCIPQMIAAGTQGERLAFPSFLYFPLEEELSVKAAALEWDQSREHCAGVFARERGAEIPDRLIGSAKSWLCNGGIDRREKSLPSTGEEKKMSPLTACAELLRHLKEAWDYKMGEDPFNEQHILITVPASFDPSARQLVQEAAQLANYPEIALLEEPQAAFYSWLHTHESDWRKQLRVGDSILVIDIGGGTTDFSLISVGEEQGDLSLNRLAVGDHLLLGGDNIDLSLAYLAKQKLEEAGHTIDERQLSGLAQACRQAKEKLLGEEAAKSADVMVMGRGSRLIGGMLKAKIAQNEARSLVLDGFIPLVGPEERSPRERRSGLQQLGLPYAQDARISCQLARFLALAGGGEEESIDNFLLPTAVLFNGGSLKAAAIQERLLALLQSWAEKLGKSSVRVLPEGDLDFAVSRGAVYYGLARLGKAIRIKSGTSRSYYVGVEDAAPAVPGFAPPLKAVCVVPFGMEEGTEKELDQQEFALVLGENASFRFFSCNTPKLADGTAPRVGSIVRDWKQALTELHPVETSLEKGEADGKTVRVKLKSKVTELGVLELWCVAPDQRKWKLEFDIRHDKKN